MSDVVRGIQPTFPLYSMVRLRRELNGIPAGSLGQIVHVHGDNEGYEVEIAAHCWVVTAFPDDLEWAPETNGQQ